jgi:hypothetical protein
MAGIFLYLSRSPTSRYRDPLYLLLTLKLSSMKAIFLLLAICSFQLKTPAQDSTSKKVFESRKEADNRIQDGKFTTSIGWTIKEGDEIKLGKGSMPDKTFAFITESPNVLTYNQYTDYNNSKLQHTYNGRGAKIAKLYVGGNKKTGFYITATIKVGQLSRYMLDIENAIEAGEIEKPAEFATQVKKEQQTATSASLGDELKKLKDLLDSGALTKEEYEAAKKKLLNQ